ncbi:MAG: hypothetical protein NTW60_02965, partial [Candidatus Wolfebacteria bacterium]|nr:hypothetical protein [Candidatus Wolfebacteria bacterium]
MTLLGELRIFVKHILYWIYSLVGFSLFFLLFGFHWVSIYGKNFILQIFSENSFSVQVFHVIKNSFLPSGVQLIVTNPWSGFVAQLEIAIILAYIVT